MCEGCGKLYKNRRGVRIHQGKSGCKPKIVTCVEALTSNQTESSQDPDANHSIQATQVQNRHVSNDLPLEEPLVVPKVLKPPKLKLPNANSELWGELNKDIDQALTHNLRGSVVQKLEKLPKIVLSLCKEKIGVCKSRP